MKLGRYYTFLLPAVGVLILVLILVAWLRPQALERQQILLGTFVQIKVYGADRAELERAVAEAFAEIARVQAAFSRMGDGELGRLNRAAPGQPVALSDEVIGLLQQAQRYHELSGGAFDVTLGGLADLWGFVEDWDGLGRVPDDAQIERWLAQPRGLELDPSGRTATRWGETTLVDLGGLAKGYAVDRAIEVLEQHPLQAALVNAGGNVRAFGQVPEPFLAWVKHRPFQVGVQHPRRDDGLLGGLSLSQATAAATSGDYQRFFMEEGQRHHHILDPNSGRPASGVISATVVAPTALEADALSTAVYVLGVERGLALVESLTGVEAVLVTEAGGVHTSGGLDSARFSF